MQFSCAIQLCSSTTGCSVQLCICPVGGWRRPDYALVRMPSWHTHIGPYLRTSAYAYALVRMPSWHTHNGVARATHIGPCLRTSAYAILAYAQRRSSSYALVRSVHGASPRTHPMPCHGLLAENIGKGLAPCGVDASIWGSEACASDTCPIGGRGLLATK